MSVETETARKRLNLGCGRNIMAGWVNLDVYTAPGIDVVADLDKCDQVPLPFADDTFDDFLASHLFEHLRNPLPMMQELHRVARPGAKAMFRVPYGSSDDAFEDPTHVRQCYLGTFAYFSQPMYWRADYGYRGDWKPTQIGLSISRKRYEGKTVDAIFQDVTHLRNVVREMIVELEAIKPIRSPLKELQTNPKIELILIDP